MSTALTIDDIWKLFQETNRLFQDSQERWEHRHREMGQMIQKTDHQIQETDRRIQETNHQIQETDRRLQETGRYIQETSAQMLETDRKLKEVSTLVGNLGGRWGEFVEGLIVPACIDMFTARGLPVDEVYTRAKKTRHGRRMEIDILAANTVDAVLIEVKSRLRVEDVRDHLTRLADFKSFFHRYAHCRVYGAVAGIVVESEADQFAMNQGLFVIEQSGESVRLANEMAFKPKVW